MSLNIPNTSVASTNNKISSTTTSSSASSALNSIKSSNAKSAISCSGSTPDLDFSLPHLKGLDFGFDVPDWKLGNLNALNKLGGMFNGINMSNLPKLKLSYLHTSGMFDSFKCLGIDSLNPHGKGLDFKKGLYDLNDARCNSINFSYNNSASRSLMSSIMYAANCDKSSKDATKVASADIESIMADDSLDATAKTNLLGAVVKGNVQGKFSIDAAKDAITTGDTKNLYKASFSGMSNPGKHMNVSDVMKKSGVIEKNSVVDEAMGYSSITDLAGNNDITKLADNATLDSTISNYENSSLLSAVNNSQKLSVIDKLKSSVLANTSGFKLGMIA